MTWKFPSSVSLRLPVREQDATQKAKAVAGAAMRSSSLNCLLKRQASALTRRASNLPEARVFNVVANRALSTYPSGGRRDFLKVSDEVSDAIAKDKPVIALESTIYTHGAMGKNLALEHEELVRSHGGIPAIIAIVNGEPTVGVSPQQIMQMIEGGTAAKVSRRDVSYLVGMVSRLSRPGNREC